MTFNKSAYINFSLHFFFNMTCEKIQKGVVAVKVKSLVSSRTMTGIEYEVLHVQDPILYVIRKQHRISPAQGREK